MKKAQFIGLLTDILLYIKTRISQDPLMWSFPSHQYQVAQARTAMYMSCQDIGTHQSTASRTAAPRGGQQPRGGQIKSSRKMQVDWQWMQTVGSQSHPKLCGTAPEGRHWPPSESIFDAVQHSVFFRKFITSSSLPGYGQARVLLR